MSVRRKDTTILIAMTLLIVVGMWYFYKGMDDSKVVSDVNLYELVAPDPEAVLAINRPFVFDKVILPQKNTGKIFTDHIPEIYLELIHDNQESPLFLLSFYPQGSVFYAPMSEYEARQVFKKLEERFSFKAQRKIENQITYRYYPEADKRFFGCYYHEGTFVASYSQKQLEQAGIRQQSDSLHIIPGLKETLIKTNPNAPVNLFVPSNALNLYVQITEITEWRIQDQWLGVNLLLNGDKLCCFHTQPYQTSLDSLFYQPGFSSFSMWNNPQYRLETLYQSMGDTIEARINKLFPQIKTTAQVSHDEAVAYFTICGS